jgi:hypothetical protein
MPVKPTGDVEPHLMSRVRAGSVAAFPRTLDHETGWRRNLLVDRWQVSSFQSFLSVAKRDPCRLCLYFVRANAGHALELVQSLDVAVLLPV